MASNLTYTLTCDSRTTPLGRRYPTIFLNPSYLYEDKRLYFRDGQTRCCVISNRRTEKEKKFLQGSFPSQNELLKLVKWQKESETQSKVPIAELVNSVKLMLGKMDEGEISISAYDTAWVALVPDANGSGLPQFPRTLEWIAGNQLPDGSWGDSDIVQAHDRLINTLGCVVALKSWNLHHDKCEKGIAYFKDNLHKLEDAKEEQMPIGFEVAFPSLMEIGRGLGIDIPDDIPILRKIYSKRNLKLQMIPKDLMHEVPTTLLHSLEGMPGLNWDKLLKLQNKDGSFLFSPSSTAYALMQTRDKNCYNYLNRIVKKFKGGVPNVYPVDLFEHIWVVDRLQRLGVARYFPEEIDQCLHYVARFWTPNGICWARNSDVNDIDDTAMAFRLLRLHGFDVSADVFKHFENGDEFVCFKGQSTQAVTGMLNLYRASQVSFPEDEVLSKARQFSSRFLLEKQATNQVLDKWIITKDLPGEVSYSLSVPWTASLPRVEARFYIDHYGGDDDVWIGKTLYRMSYVNNDTYLQLAKLDYSHCQAIHLAEWSSFQKWYDEAGLYLFGVTRTNLLVSYFVAAASLFEPEMSQQRLGWATTLALIDMVSSFRDNDIANRTDFVEEFLNRKMDRSRTGHEVVKVLNDTLDHLAVNVFVNSGRDISSNLRNAWRKWLATWSADGDRRRGEAELVVKTLLLISEQIPHLPNHNHPEYKKLAELSNKLCFELGEYQSNKMYGSNGKWKKQSGGMTTTPEIEAGMQKLVQLVFERSSEGLDANVKQTFWVVVRTFYYLACCSKEMVSHHISKVLFEKVH